LVSRHFTLKALLGFLMVSMLAAASAKLTEFQPLGRRLLILSRYVITTLAISALQHNIIAWHN
jgi:hypothetical protein